MIAIGAKIRTDLMLKIVKDGGVKEMTLGELLTRRTVVSVYMKNNTGSCDRQVDSLGTIAGQIEQKGYELVALSRDTTGSHLRYAAKKGIVYPLVSDPKDAFARAADSIVEKSMYGRKFFGPARAVFVLDRDGTVLAMADKVDTAEHGAQVLALIDGLK